jgi:LPS sulfotransferase NodH
VLAATFPHLRYVWLRREDRVRQAISYYRALVTKIWRSTDVGLQSSKEPPFDALAIKRLVELCTWEDEAWEEFFYGFING